MTRIFVPIDTPDLNNAKQIIAKITAAGCGIKLGMEFVNANGPQGISTLKDTYPDTPLFIDLKYHDIPNTVAGALRAITRLSPDFVNVHASGGTAMMQAGLEAMQEEAARLNIPAPKLLAVTVLTSIDEDTLESVGWGRDVQSQVERLAKLTQSAGLAGVVCSPLEIETVRRACGDDFITMVPGIRPQNLGDDQMRVMTPKQAIEAGATYLVIGRPITASPDPAQAAANIMASLSA